MAYCRQCGMPVGASHHFCHYCGAELTTGPADTLRPKRASRLRWIIPAIVVGLGLAGLVTFIATRGPGNAPQRTAPEIAYLHALRAAPFTNPGLSLRGLTDKQLLDVGYTTCSHAPFVPTAATSTAFGQAIVEASRSYLCPNKFAQP